MTLPSTETGSLPDIDLCAREPVQTIGQIQPHGLLFALSESDLIVRHVSTNVTVLLGMSPASVLDHSFQAVLGARQFELFKAQVLAEDLFASEPLRVRVGPYSIAMHCIAHRQDGVLIVELELLAGAYSLEPVNLGSHVRIPLSRMELASGILDLSRLAADEIRRLSGFDRVLVYRFDEAWNGEVIAEASGSTSGSYLGLRFPASDIPPQVRQLFLINPLRLIADIAVTPVPIIPAIGPLTGKPLDLTRSLLRSAAPVHLEYMRNMGVQSSMTVSILVEHQLWGMITCHHASPRRVDHSTRSVCELIGQILASQVALRIDNLALQSQLKSRKLLGDYMASLEASKSLADTEHFQSRQLLDLLDADGLVSRIDGFTSYLGASVSEELLLPSIARLQNLSSRGIASSNMLSALDPEASAFATQVSGALHIGLTDGPGDYLLILRREIVDTVIWAGNPDKGVSADEQGRLRPRASFEAWQETVRGRSRPWTELELERASFLREQLLRLREAQKLRKAEERVRYLAHHDSMTGLINRHSLNLKLEQCVKEAAASQSSFAVLFIDLDHFKHFNDTLGHAVGDRILQIVAKRMQHQVRSEDIVGRLGGDEFIIILLGLRLEVDLMQTVARILRSVEEPLGIEDEPNIQISASIGLSRYPMDGTTSEVLVSRSDMAMYRVKRSGGNACELFREDSQEYTEHTA